MKAEVQFDVRKLQPGDSFAGFSLGDAAFLPLKTFLTKHAKRFHESNLAKTYGVFTEAERIAGYVTLVCGEVVIDEGDDALIDDQDFRYKQYPAIKIARLAVHSAYRRIGLGNQLVQLALGIAKDQICEAVGCRFVVVDAKKQSVPFYLRQGFTLLNTAANRERDEPVMFIDLSKV